MADLPVELQSFLLFHRSMRVGAERFAAAVSETPDAPDGRLAALTAWFDRYRTACLIHATGEDDVLWPALRDARPDLDALFTTMDAEHHELSAALDRVAGWLAEAAVAEAKVAAKDLLRLVTKHLDHEEDLAVPALVAAVGPDLGDLMRRVQQGAGPAGAAVALPFLLEHATDDERSVVLGGLPPPVKEGLAAWEQAHRQLSNCLDGGQR